MFLCQSAIDITSALVCEFEDKVIIHEPETDKIHLLDAGIVSLLNVISLSIKKESDLLNLVHLHCLNFAGVENSAPDDCKAYLQHLVDQGIIKKTQ